MPYKHLLHFALNKELSEVYITHVIRSFAFALIGIFVPAYMITIGYPVQSVFYYFLYWAMCSFVLMILIPKLYTKIGIKHAILFSTPFFIGYFLLLYSLETYSWNLFFIAFVSALANSFYWPAFHIEFVRSSDRKHRGEELGTMNVLAQLTVIFAPLMGGLVIFYWGFKILFGFVALLLLVSPISLFFSKEVYTPVKFSIKSIFHKDHLKNFFVFFVEGVINYAETVIWVIFIFLALKSFISLGFLATLIILFTTFMTFIMGRLSDVTNKRKLMRVGMFSLSIIWFFRTAAKSFLHFGILNSLFGIAFTFLSLPYIALFYNKAAKHRPAEFIVFREVSLALGRISIMMFIILTGSFIGSFIIAGFSSLIFLLF